ncbi:hypothetical protein DFH09DRAFT_1328057 [Mycena vulgaris]|nr:hypothetical protein DFH09DRAFT_1328057 [Mycena vulgaris]
MPSVQLTNIRAGYEQLEKKVQTALRTQLGDAERLGLTSASIAQFRTAAEPNDFPAAEFAVLQRNLADMQAALDRAVTKSSDPLTTPLLKVIEKRPNGKGTGRPHLEIQP